jgi:large subunit ribosomal protein L9
MKIILRQDYETLGEIGSIVDVKPGYARNFLIPRGIAMRITKGNQRVLEEDKKRQRLRTDKALRGAEAQKAKLEAVSVTAPVQVGEEDKVFGSVTSLVIAELLKEKGFEVERRRIQLDEPIKALGIYDVPIKLHTDVTATIKVWVVKS